MSRDRREVLVDAHRTFNPHCWFCGKQLGAVFTSIKKRGVDCRVHPECRAKAISGPYWEVPF